MKLLALRHGPTDWNDAGRIQGHSDIPLSDRAHGIFAVRQVPEEALGWRWFASPLARAQTTARLLGVPSPALEPRLREMNWGDWEGCTRRDIAERHGDEMVARLEARGLDFRPPGGESPRELCERLSAWLGEQAAGAGPNDHLGLVAHKGVLKGLLGIATGWDLHGKMPHKLDWSRAHRFELTAASPWQLSLDRPNIPLQRTDGGDPEAPIPEW